MPVSFQLGCIYSDRVEVWLLHTPIDKLGNLIWIFYVFRCSLLDFRKNIFNFSIRFQNNKFENFKNIINSLFRLWSKIMGSCHDDNKREQLRKEKVKEISGQVFSWSPMWKNEQIRGSHELLPLILTLVKTILEGQNLLQPL